MSCTAVLLLTEIFKNSPNITVDADGAPLNFSWRGSLPRVDADINRLGVFHRPFPEGILDDHRCVISHTQLQIENSTPLVPPHMGQGVLLFIQNYETVLLRRSDGTPDLVQLKDAPGDIEIVGKIDAAQFDLLVSEQLKKMVAAAGEPYTRFLLRLDNVPLSPYIYIDTQKHVNVQLQLPDYYEVKKRSVYCPGQGREYLCCYGMYTERYSGIYSGSKMICS